MSSKNFSAVSDKICLFTGSNNISSIPKEDKITDIEKLAKMIKEGVDPNE